MKRVYFTIIVFFLLISCKSNSDNEIIYKVSQDALTSIRNNDVEKFKSLIGNDNVKKDTELISFNVNRLNRLFNAIYDNREEKPLIEVTERYNFLGQMCVKIPIYENKKASDISEMHLNLLFGPPSLFSLNKITGYTIVENNSDSADFKPYSYWKSRGLAK